MNEIIVAGSLSNEAVERLRKVMRKSKATNTLLAYRDDFKVFSAWCASENQKPLPADGTVVAAFLAWYAENHRASSVARRLAGILWCHRAAGFPDLAKNQAVKVAMEGIQREDGMRPTRKAPADGAVLKDLLATVPGTPLMIARDRALLLIGYAGAFRREALCALNVSDLTFRDTRLDIRVQRGKEDQKGKGRLISVARQPGTANCAVDALSKWLAVGNIDEGPVFRAITRHGRVSDTRLSSKVVARVVKKAALAAGLDESTFAGHSLRAGHITEAARQGARIDEIMRVSGHKLADTVLRYMREADPLAGTSATKIWEPRGAPLEESSPRERKCKSCGRVCIGKKCRCEREQK